MACPKLVAATRRSRLIVTDTGPGAGLAAARLKLRNLRPDPTSHKSNWIAVAKRSAVVVPSTAPSELKPIPWTEPEADEPSVRLLICWPVAAVHTVVVPSAVPHAITAPSGL